MIIRQNNTQHFNLRVNRVDKGFIFSSLNYWYTHVGWENYAYNYKRQPIIEILNLY